MKKTFLSNLLLLLFLNLLVKPFWVLGIDRTVQNVVGAENYGFYYALLNFSFLFNILLDMGITSFNNRNIAQNQQLLGKHFSGIVIIKLLLAVVYALLTLGVALIVGFNLEQFKLLLILCFNQFLLSFILYLRSNISGLLLFRTDSMLSVLDRIIMIILCSMLLWGHVTSTPFKIQWFVYIQTIAYVLTAFVALTIVMTKSKFQRLRWNWPFIVMIIRQSFPFALLVLLMTIYNRIDPVMLERLLPASKGEYEVGVYASAYRLLDAFNMIAYLFAVLLLPIFSRMLKQRDDVVQVIRLSFSLLYVMSATVAVASFYYSNELMDLMYHDHVEESAAVLRLLMFVFVAVSTTYVFGTLLTANNSLKILNIIATAGVLLSLVFNIFLVPRFYSVGSAWASLISQFITALLQVVVSVRIFRISINWRFLSALAVFTVGLFLWGFISKMFSLNWLFNLGLMMVGSTILAVLLRLLDVSAIMKILLTREN